MNTAFRLPEEGLAAVFRAPGQPFSFEHFPLPALRGSEALVRITCATVCGSDLHSYFGRRHAPCPSVLGHEMVGEVVALGPEGAHEWEGEALRIGDRVTWSMVWSCGQCFYCRSGLRPKCERLRKFGHGRLAPGQEFFGGFAEFCWLPEGTAIFRVPEAVPDLVASPANCATATVAAMLRHAGEVRGQQVVVLGAGMLGLTACAMAASGGAASVIAIDRDESRLRLAAAFGATACVSAGSTAREQVLALTAERGADLLLELTGSPDATEAGIDLLRFGGHLVLAGAVFPARALSLSAEQVVRRMLRISGVYNYNPEDLRAALAFLAGVGGGYPFAALVGGRYPLRELQQAMEAAEILRAPRVAVRASYK